VITQKIIEFLAALGRFVLGLFPSVTAPDWLTTTLPDALRTIVNGLQSIDALLPLEVASLGLTAVLVACGVALGIKLARIVASFLTAGGGSAA
jgi:hypothetical protein